MGNSNSNTKFNKNSTAMEAADNIDLNGKVVAITGCNTGIGKETARVLAIHGAKIYMLCRNLEKANKAKQDIIESIKENDEYKDFDENNINILELDLSSLLSVRKCVGKYLSLNEPLHCLINNAGVMAISKWTPSKDGYEMQFATNHLGHFYLTLLLTPLLLKYTPTRVINLASSAHSFGPKIDNDNKDNFIIDGINRKDGPSPKNYKLRGWTNYGLSKTCNILFAREYNRRYQKHGIISVSLHPGAIKTELQRHSTGAGSLLSIGSAFAKSIPQGAATTVRCISLSNEQIAPGHYYQDCNEANNSLRKDVKPYRGKKKVATVSDKEAKVEEDKLGDEEQKTELQDNDDVNSAEYKLWEWSELLIVQKGFKLDMEGSEEEEETPNEEEVGADEADKADKV